MKRTLTILVLCMLLLATVGATVAVAKAEAKGPASKTYLPVQYKVGKTYTFLPRQYNNHITQYDIWFGAPQHTEVSQGMTASVSTKAVVEELVWSEANVGTNLQLTKAPADMAKQCKVTVTTSYSVWIYTSTTNQGLVPNVAGAGIRAGSLDDQIGYVEPVSPHTAESQEGSGTYVLTGTLAQIFSGTDNTCFAGASVAASSVAVLDFNEYAAASANVNVQSISITFLE